jgi:hypothetical protein
MGNEEILKKTDEGMREGNRILIQELVHDLEKKGIVPVGTKQFQPEELGKQLDWYRKSLKKFDYKESDFCLLEEDKTNYSNFIYELDRNILVIKKDSGKVKKYPLYRPGGCYSWTISFEADLQNKFFE